MAAHHWTFTDPQNNVLTLPINPRDLTDRQSKRFSTEGPVHPGASRVRFQGDDEVRTVSVSGVILTENHYDLLTDWYRKSTYLRWQDDLGYTFLIQMTSFETKREARHARGPTRPHQHRRDYTLSWDVVREL